MKSKKNSKFAVNIQIPRRVTIKVTKKDIEQGEFNEETSCPIALAVKRTLGDSPRVPGEVFHVTMDGLEVCYGLPKVADDFISKFDEIDGLDFDDQTDAKKKLKPFSFVAKYSHHDV